MNVAEDGVQLVKDDEVAATSDVAVVAVLTDGEEVGVAVPGGDQVGMTREMYETENEDRGVAVMIGVCWTRNKESRVLLLSFLLTCFVTDVVNEQIIN